MIFSRLKSISVYCMDYNKYLREGMKQNQREKRYDQLMCIPYLDLPRDVLDTIRQHYKWDAIQEELKSHYRYEVMRELRYKAYYSKHMFDIYTELHINGKDADDYLTDGEVDDFLIHLDDD